MKRYGYIMGIVLIVSPVSADIFKHDDTPQPEFDRAVNTDSWGEYYHLGLDAHVTSMFKGPYNYGTDTLKRRLSRQSDLNASVHRQVPKVLSGMDINAAMRQINTSPLILWQYSSPAAADLFKHFHTAAQMKLNMYYEDLLAMERNVQGDLDYVRDQSELECVREKMARRQFEGDIVDLLISCRDMGSSPGAVFSHLNYTTGSFKLYERLFNRLHFRSRSDEILDIVPQWTINPDGYELKGPEKRIGDVLSELRAENLEVLVNSVRAYALSKTVDAGDLAKLSMPGVPFHEQAVRNLAALNESTRYLIMGHIAGRLAYEQTVERYDVGLEWLGRILTHPMVEESYKRLVRMGMDYLQGEKRTLGDKYAGLAEYAEVMRLLMRTSQANNEDSLRRVRDGIERIEHEEESNWTK